MIPEYCFFLSVRYGGQYQVTFWLHVFCSRLRELVGEGEGTQEAEMYQFTAVDTT